MNLKTASWQPCPAGLLSHMVQTRRARRRLRQVVRAVTVVGPLAVMAAGLAVFYMWS